MLESTLRALLSRKRSSGAPRRASGLAGLPWALETAEKCLRRFGHNVLHNLARRLYRINHSSALPAGEASIVDFTFVTGLFGQLEANPHRLQGKRQDFTVAPNPRIGEAVAN